MSWKTKNCSAEDFVIKISLEEVLKACLKDFFKTSWRQAKCLLRISVSNKSKSITNASKANPKYIN